MPALPLLIFWARKLLVFLATLLLRAGSSLGFCTSGRSFWGWDCAAKIYIVEWCSGDWDWAKWEEILESKPVE